MRTSLFPALRARAKKPLAVGVILAFGITAHDAFATTRTVSDCTDGAGSGTLRHTIAAANSADIIELKCSRITLTTGVAISIPQNDLSIVEAPNYSTLIDGGSESATPTDNTVFYHFGTGTLSISGGSIAYGHYVRSDSPTGGCIFSMGNVTLTDEKVFKCTVSPGTATVNSAGGAIYAKGNVSLTRSYVGKSTLEGDGTNSISVRGGGIFAGGSVTLANSSIVNNTATATGTEKAVGGGIFATAGLTVVSSVLSGNEAIAASAFNSRGGAVYVAAGSHSTLIYSTVSMNSASINSGIESHPATATDHFYLIDSTVTENYAHEFQTIAAYGPTTIANSTIASNGAFSSAANQPVGLYSNYSIDLEGSIIANNIGTGGENDVNSFVGLTGSNNLILEALQSTPTNTVSTCPKLGPLIVDGVHIPTLPLLPGSPAINAGNNTQNLNFDERGKGFPRVVGSAADIGAYEFQTGESSDGIFAGKFEGRCD